MASRPWTDGDVQILRERFRHEGTQGCAAALRRTVAAVRIKARQLGLTTKRRARTVHHVLSQHRVIADCPVHGITEHSHSEPSPSRNFHVYRCLECQREGNRRIAYGVTPEGYGRLKDRAGGTCEICGEQDPALHIDHDHSTGNVRGLLCANCNRGLGMFRDDPGILRKAIEYLGHRRGEEADNRSALRVAG